MENIGTSLLNLCVINEVFFKEGLRLNLAIVTQPFLSWLITGRKTIESRFSINKCSPYHKLKKDDIIFIKDSAKPIIGYTRVKQVEYFSNFDNSLNLSEMSQNYSSQICANDDFWQMRRDKNYATLIWVDKPKLISPTKVDKHDKRGWVDFELKYPQTLILLSGKIGSGKTFWANKLANVLNCNRNSFSDYLKIILTKRNKRIDRKNLQDIGERIVNNELYNFLNYTLLNNFNKNNILVIDGLRHVKVLNKCKELINNVIHINVDIPENIRKGNIVKREGFYDNCLENNKIECENEKLRKIADVIINENSSLYDIICEIKERINKEQQIKMF